MMFDTARTMTEDFDVRLAGNMALITPDPEYRKNSWLGDYETAYRGFQEDPDKFWSGIARELDWIREWDTVKEWNYPYARGL